jgi:hypothetical protein
MRKLRSAGTCENLSLQDLPNIGEKKREFKINNEIADARNIIYSEIKRRKLNPGNTDYKEQDAKLRIEYEEKKKSLKTSISKFLYLKTGKHPTTHDINNNEFQKFNFEDDFEDDLLPKFISSSIESSEMQEYEKRCKTSDCDYFDENDNNNMYWTDDNNIDGAGAKVDGTDILYNFSLINENSFKKTRTVDENIDISKRYNLYNND